MTVTYRTQSTTSIQRDAWLEINLSAIERNYRKLSDLLKTNIMAVVKADAYGHGATTLCPILQSLGVNSFGVATVDEGIALRNAGIKKPILILGATPFWTYESCYKNDLTITIHSEDQVEALENFSRKLKEKLQVQLKIDTGMNRLGIDYQKADNTIRNILNSSYLSLTGIFTHLADAKNIDFSKTQKERFDLALKNHKDLNITKHIANSYASIYYPDFRYNLIRIGIALYGYDGQEFDFLEPLISLKGRITQIHKVQKGEPVSYNCTWKASKDSLIATIPLGYADGIDRNLSNKITAKYNGNLIKQVGIITMDQMMFDISEAKNPKINDVITLIDKELSISRWAEELHTITYELICRFKMRILRVYTRD